MMSFSFAEFLNQYFNNYLIIQKNCSNNTIRSYKTTFKLLIKYLIDYKNVSIKELSFEYFTRNNVIDFLNYLENNLKISISSRNQRLAAIKSFCNYISYEKIEHINDIQQILSIPLKKCSNNMIDYLTKEELTNYLNSIEVSTRKGIRDYTLITLMYDSAARASEITNIKVNDLNLGDNPSVVLYGKGNKYRTVPITDETKNLLINYISLFELNSISYLFGGNNNKSSTKMITHIVKKYARKFDIDKNIHPHVFRHTRAMHLLEADIPLVYIRDLLGHESITTTEIYAKINIELKRKSLASVYKVNDISCNKDAIWNKDEELIKSLLDI